MSDFLSLSEYATWQCHWYPLSYTHYYTLRFVIKLQVSKSVYEADYV